MKASTLYNNLAEEKVKKDDVANDTYLIKKAIFANHTLPRGYKKINVLTVDKDRYRVNIVTDDNKVCDSYFVVKTEDNNFAFNPPLGEKRD